MSDEFDLAVQRSMDGQGLAARIGFIGAQGTDPDKQAEAVRLARQAGVPVDTAVNLPDDVRQKAASQAVDFNQLAKTSPTTAALLADIQKAKIAHDDVANMTMSEGAVNGLKAGWEGDFKSGVRLTQALSNARVVGNIDRVEQMIKDGTDPNTITAQDDPLGVATMTPEQRDVLRSQSSELVGAHVRGASEHVLAGMAIPQHPSVASVMNASKGLEGWNQVVPTLKAFAQDPINFIVSTGSRSLASQAPGLALAAGANILGMPGAAIGITGLNSYATDFAASMSEFLRDQKGLDPRDTAAMTAALQDPALVKEAAQAAFSHAWPVAALDMISYGAAGKTILPPALEKTLEGKPLMKNIINALLIQPQVQGALGGAGEFAGQVASGQKIDFPNILAEWAGEHFGAPLEVVSASAGKIHGDLVESRKAGQNAEVLERLRKLSEVSKLRERDPQSFQEFVDAAAENGEVTDVYISAKVLAQSGLVDQLAAVSPSVAQQFDDAIKSGGDVRIPLGEFAANIAPQEYAQSLIEHLKVTPDALTMAQGKLLEQTQLDDLRTEIERVMSAKQGDETFRTSIDAVKSEMTRQLGEANRFTPQVNDLYATLVAARYGVAAAQMGVTPEELYQRYPYQVSAQPIVGNVYEQAAIADGMIEKWAGGELPQGKNIDMGAPSEILKSFGITGDQINLSVGILDKARDRHSVTPANLFGLATALHNPLAVFRSKKGESHRVVVTELHQGGENLVVAVELHQAHGKITVDQIRSIHPKQNQSIRNWINEGLLLGYEKNKGPEWLGGIPAPIAGAGQVSEAPAIPILYEANRELNQGARGTFNPETLTTTLLKKADLSTFLHETGHFFLEMQFDMAGKLMAEANAFGIEGMKPGEQQIIRDAQAILDWFGLKDLGEWAALDFEEKRSYHEKFARGFEAYLFEGKAPSIEIQGAFQRFRAWLIAVYKDIKKLDVELTDEVRQVFDRMIATTEQIQLAEQARSMMPLFESAQQAGMTIEEFAAYHALGIDATNDAIQDLQARGLRDLQWLHNLRTRELKRLQKDAADRRAEVTMDVRAQVMSQPVYRAWQFLTSKLGVEDNPAGRLYLADAEAMGLPESTVELLKARRMTTKDEAGLHPDVVAEMFGFTSGDEMMQKLAAAHDPKEEIEGLVDAAMLEQYGDLASPEAIERAADQAIHNEARTRMVATEMAALEQAMSVKQAAGTDVRGRKRSVSILPAAAKEFAAAMIARLKVREIRPSQYANAEARAAREAQKASRQGDIARAAAEKRNQLINLFATRAALAAQEMVDKGVKYLKQFGSESTRKGLSSDYLEQIDALLERFDLRKGQSLAAIDKRTALASWLESQREQGMEPDIPPELVNEAYRKSYKDLTIEEFQGLLDAVKQIEHLGRLKNKLLTAADQRAYEAVRDEIVASVIANAGDRTADARTPTTNMGRGLQALKKFWASHIKAAIWARVMDGNKDGGPMWEYFVRSANKRGDMETTMRAEATQKLSEIMAPVLNQGRMGGKGKYFASVDKSFNREALIAIALNTGNEGNLQRLLGGENWSLQQLQPLLQSLTAAELHAVQAVWDHFESYRPKIAAKERRVYGKEPNWVEPRPFTVKSSDGQTIDMKGGYYPIKYDPAATLKAEQHADAEGAKRQLQGAYTSATTRRSFTKSRVEEVKGRPLLYTLAGMYSGVNDVIHDLSWHEWLIDVNRLMRSKTLDQAIRSHYGPDAKQQFKTWINDIAEGEKGTDHAVDMALGKLRQGISAAGLGFNVMSAAMQVLGFNQSIVRVGAGWVGRGIARYIANPIEAVRYTNDKSTFMANRSRTRFRELNELRNQVQGESKTMSALHAGTYFLMMRAQQMVDVPTWIGAHEKAMAAGNSDERAVELADQAVIDSQGGGQTKDLAAIERGGQAQRLFTVFYSFMNTALNLGVAQTMTSTNRAKLAADYLMLYSVPAVLGTLLKQALTPGGSPDDWDAKKLAKKLAAEQLSYLMGLMVVVREFQDVSKIVTGAEGARDYGGPAGLRAIGDTIKMGAQARQLQFDDAFRKAAINLIGDFAALPAAQINRTINGATALHEGKTSNPAALVFGFNQKH